MPGVPLSPTFEAAQLDIDPLLGTVLKEIDRRLEEQCSLTSFLAYRHLEEGKANVRLATDLVDYRWCNFRQVDLELSLKIQRSVLEQIEKATKEHAPEEYGGILLGYYTQNRKEARVYEIYNPKTYKAGPSYFERPCEELNLLLREKYSATDGIFDYLGEWHSHPQGPLAPSDVDRRR